MISLRWAEWEPTYARILDDFRYDRKADEEARDLLAQLAAGLPRPKIDLRGHDVIIAGPTPPHEKIATPRRPGEDGRLIATDAATWAFDDAIAIVTDLDGNVDAQLAANARGTPLYVHAHGDNMPALRRHVPHMRGPVQPTTQAAPTPDVANYGGFTDGDRACCIAVALGAASLALAGFDFDEPAQKAGRDRDVKRRKLAWARRIIYGLGVPIRTL